MYFIEIILAQIEKHKQLLVIGDYHKGNSVMVNLN